MELVGFIGCWVLGISYWVSGIRYLVLVSAMRYCYLFSKEYCNVPVAIGTTFQHSNIPTFQQKSQRRKDIIRKYKEIPIPAKEKIAATQLVW